MGDDTKFLNRIRNVDERNSWRHPLYSSQDVLNEIKKLQEQIAELQKKVVELKKES